MAIIDKASFIAEIQKVADALNTAMAENGGSGMAIELRSPSHPLRKVEKLFNFDAGLQCEVTSDDDYIEGSYAGLLLSKGSEFDKVVDFTENIDNAYLLNWFGVNAGGTTGDGSMQCDAVPNINEIYGWAQQGPDGDSLFAQNGKSYKIYVKGDIDNYIQVNPDDSWGAGLSSQVKILTFAVPAVWSNGTPANDTDVIIEGAYQL